MTKYEKGSFITVPNRKKLAGLRPATQCLHTWLCCHANAEGDCFPSRKLLAKECGFKSARTVDKHMKILIDEGLVVKNSRTKNNVKQSNLYTVIITAEIETENKDGEVEQNLPINKQGKIDEVEQILRKGVEQILPIELNSVL